MFDFEIQVVDNGKRRYVEATMEQDGMVYEFCFINGIGKEDYIYSGTMQKDENGELIIDNDCTMIGVW